jgi:hypothetical protein
VSALCEPQLIILVNIVDVMLLCRVVHFRVLSLAILRIIMIRHDSALVLRLIDRHLVDIFFVFILHLDVEVADLVDLNLFLHLAELVI